MTDGTTGTDGTDGTDDTYTRTRRCLHGVAELVLSGPRFRQTGDLRLRVRPEGIGTWDEPVVALACGELVTPAGRVVLTGLTIAEAARLAGLEVSALDDVYHDGPHVDPSTTIHLDGPSVQVVEEALTTGDQALAAFRPEAERILWPEHFDVAITADGVNYGVSPGDDHHARPYAYAGPHHPVSGDFWNAPFGASRPLDAFPDVDSVTAFFREASRLAAA
jgi:hypothetical protein